MVPRSEGAGESEGAVAGAARFLLREAVGAAVCGRPGFVAGIESDGSNSGGACIWIMCERPNLDLTYDSATVSEHTRPHPLISLLLLLVSRIQKVDMIWIAIIKC